MLFGKNQANFPLLFICKTQEDGIYFVLLLEMEAFFIGRAGRKPLHL
jgi:hypothetical protein